MPKSAKHTFEEITINYPNKLIRSANIFGGLAIVAISAVSLLYVFGIFAVFEKTAATITRFGMGQATFDILMQSFGVRRGSMPQDIVKALAAIAALVLFLIYYVKFSIAAYGFGLGKLGKGLLQWRNSGIPHGVPEQLESPLGVMIKLIKREKYSSEVKPGEITALFGLNAQHLSPVAAKAAMRNFGAGRIRWIKGVVRDVFGMVVVAAAVTWLHMQLPSNQDLTGVAAQLLQSAGLWPSLARVLFPMSLAAIVLIVFTAADYLFVSLMVPKASWSSDSETRVDRAVASLPPNLIFHEFPARMGSHRNTDEPNFIYPLASEIAATSVGETGNFALSGLIEQDAVAVANPDEAAAKFRLLTGWAFILLGFVTVLFGLWPASASGSFLARALPPADIFVMPIVQIATGILGIRLLRRGRAHITESEALLEAHWFKSQAIAFQMRGTTSKSEIKIGGTNDSIGTTSIVYRSEFLYDVTASTLISEAKSLDGERELVSFEKTNQSSDLLGAAISEIRAIVSTRAKPISVDLTHGGLQDQIDANLKVESLRAGGIEAARIEARQGVVDRLGKNPQPPLLADGQDT